MIYLFIYYIYIQHLNRMQITYIIRAGHNPRLGRPDSLYPSKLQPFRASIIIITKSLLIEGLL